ncbi:hypothetical protein ACJMK2_024916 [Sinanodonta woodiana]|uniref:Uncharacterized protein n=1 Tax=Sinanodonta woodiana TaxID=1069815 RepID=A0ABD3XIQ5_SINWO
MIYGTVHAAWEPKIYVPGDNVTLQFDQLDINDKNVLEVTFSGYTINMYDTNVMLYRPMTNDTDINRNYAGRIQRFKLNKDGVSFILLNVSFIDSGNYKVIENSIVKARRRIIVPRQRLLGQNKEPIIVSFTFNMANVTSIITEMMISKQNNTVFKYDVASENLTEVGSLYSDRIEGCVLKGNIFSFTIGKIAFTDVGIYTARDNMNILMDSVLLEVEDSITTLIPETTGRYFTSHNILNSRAESYLIEWIFLSAVVVLLIVAGLIAMTLRMLINRTISKITCKRLAHKNGRQNIVDGCCSRFQNTEIRHIMGGNTMQLRQTYHDNTTINCNQLCNRSEYSAHSNVSKVFMEPIVSWSCEALESEHTFEYDRVQYDEIKN